MVNNSKIDERVNSLGIQNCEALKLIVRQRVESIGPQSNTKSFGDDGTDCAVHDMADHCFDDIEQAVHILGTSKADELYGKVGQEKVIELVEKTALLPSKVPSINEMRGEASTAGTAIENGKQKLIEVGRLDSLDIKWNCLPLRARPEPALMKILLTVREKLLSLQTAILRAVENASEALPKDLAKKFENSEIAIIRYIEGADSGLGAASLGGLAEVRDYLKQVDFVRSSGAADWLTFINDESDSREPWFPDIAFFKLVNKKGEEGAKNLIESIQWPPADGLASQFDAMFGKQIFRTSISTRDSKGFLHFKGKEYSLTSTEHKFLELIIQNPGITYAQLHEQTKKGPTSHSSEYKSWLSNVFKTLRKKGVSPQDLVKYQDNNSLGPLQFQDEYVT